MLGTNVYPAKNAVHLYDLPLGALVKDVDTTYYGYPITWILADKNHEGYPENSVTLASERVLSIKPFDALEPLNPEPYFSSRGNSRYIRSNIRQWANSEANAGEWYSPQHIYDASPTPANIQLQRNAYDQEAGFINGFSPRFRASLMMTALTVIASDYYGGENDVFTDRIFLASLAEVGLQNDKKIDEGSILALFKTTANLRVYPTQECVTHSEYTSSSLALKNAYQWWTRSAYTRDTYTCTYVSASGVSASMVSNYTTNGFRPFCNLPDSTRVSREPDADGAYIIFA